MWRFKNVNWSHYWEWLKIRTMLSLAELGVYVGRVYDPMAANLPEKHSFATSPTVIYYVVWIKYIIHVIYYVAMWTHYCILVHLHNEYTQYVSTWSNGGNVHLVIYFAMNQCMGVIAKGLYSLNEGMSYVKSREIGHYNDHSPLKLDR